MFGWAGRSWKENVSTGHYAGDNGAPLRTMKLSTVISNKTASLSQTPLNMSRTLSPTLGIEDGPVGQIASSSLHESSVDSAAAASSVESSSLVPSFSHRRQEQQQLVQMYQQLSTLQLQVTQRPSIQKCVRCVSYNVLSDSKCKNLTYTASKFWDTRKVTLIQEIASYEVDILMLQDVDHFADWWQPQLMMIGLDAIYVQKTQTRDSFDEGVVIAYRRDKFQLFKTVQISFNQALENEKNASTSFREKCCTDDVALIAMLQPFATNSFSSALCIVSALLPEDPTYTDVRSVHVSYLSKRIELANGEFHAPVVMGISLNDVPHGPAYHILATGRKTLTMEPPGQCRPPYGKPFCRSSVTLKW